MKDVLDVGKLLSNPSLEVARVCNLTDNSWDGIQQALLVQPGLIAFANVRYREAKSDEIQADWRYRQAVREAFARLREEGAAIGQAREEAELDETAEAAYREYLEAEREAGIWRALVDGLSSRENMLQQLSSRQREEFRKHHHETGPSGSASPHNEMESKDR